MKYIRTKEGITTNDKATHVLTDHICCAGYLRTLDKGAYVRIGEQWTNFYGHWVDIIDENGCHYSIRPNEVEKVTKELPQADTIEELVDELVVVEPNNEDCPRPYILDCFHLCTYNSWFEREKEHIKIGTIVVYGSIWVDGELHKAAKMNDKGELELL